MYLETCGSAQQSSSSSEYSLTFGTTMGRSGPSRSFIAKSCAFIPLTPFYALGTGRALGLHICGEPKRESQYSSPFQDWQRIHPIDRDTEPHRFFLKSASLLHARRLSRSSNSEIPLF